jgi:hypothetical protein
MRLSSRVAMATLALVLTLGSAAGVTGQAPPPYFAITGARIVTGAAAVDPVEAAALTPRRTRGDPRIDPPHSPG